MMALWEVKKTGRGQVIDLAQYEAVAQTQGNCMPLYTGQGITYGHTGNRAPGFQPYDTFKCSDGWVFIGALGDPMVSRLAAFLGLDTAVYNFASVSRDVEAVNSAAGKEYDRRLREYCAGKTTLEAENELNAARIGCARVLNPADQYADRQYNAREMTVPVLDRQSGVPVRVYGVVPKMSLTPGRIWRGAASIGEDTTDILSNLLGLSSSEIDRLYSEEVVHRTEPFTTRRWRRCTPKGKTTEFSPCSSTWDMPMPDVVLQSAITCPECGHTKLETMPTDASIPMNAPRRKAPPRSAPSRLSSRPVRRIVFMGGR